MIAEDNRNWIGSTAQKVITILGVIWVGDSWLTKKTNGGYSFYNLRLTQNEVELRVCPPVNVSINTDNNGVFAARLLVQNNAVGTGTINNLQYSIQNNLRKR